ncbi:hypothetical protein [Micromonospora rhizosphaerae]|nr:hypothetical protein [Micromonospora rhizosphaerae]
MLLAVLTIGAIPVTHDLLQAAEQEVSIEAYDRTANPGVIVAL